MNIIVTTTYGGFHTWTVERWSRYNVSSLYCAREHFAEHLFPAFHHTMALCPSFSTLLLAAAATTTTVKLSLCPPSSIPLSCRGTQNQRADNLPLLNPVRRWLAARALAGWPAARGPP